MRLLVIVRSGRIAENAEMSRGGRHYFASLHYKEYRCRHQSSNKSDGTVIDDERGRINGDSGRFM
jgi:hypothetical protein